MLFACKDVVLSLVFACSFQSGQLLLLMLFVFSIFVPDVGTVVYVFHLQRGLWPRGVLRSLNLSLVPAARGQAVSKQNLASADRTPRSTLRAFPLPDLVFISPFRVTMIPADAVQACFLSVFPSSTTVRQMHRASSRISLLF